MMKAESRARAEPVADVADVEYRDKIDEASAESFPASDPPSWTLGIDAARAVRTTVDPENGILCDNKPSRRVTS